MSLSSAFRNSKTTKAFRDLISHTWKAVKVSQTLGSIVRFISNLFGVGNNLLNRVVEGIRDSTVYSLTLSLTKYGNSSKTVYLLSNAEKIIKNSWLYSSFTENPENEPVTVDLKKTYSIGPVFEIIGVAFKFVLPAWFTSTVGKIARYILERTREAPIRYLSILVIAAVTINLVLTLTTSEVSEISFGLNLGILVLAFAGTRIRMSSDEISDKRLFQKLAQVLEPPKMEDTDDKED